MPNNNLLKISNLSISDQEWLLAQNFPGEEFLNWFIASKRDLPWRNHPSFYEVLVSEIMLQQTVVLAVIPYYNKWMIKYPSFYHLAKAPIEEVIKSWEGLGYYSRARNLHAIAKILIEHEGCGLPSNYDDLRKLKGIGDYTAKAILAFAYKRPEIAVDGNVLRVGARYLGLQDSIKSSKTKKRIQDFFDSCDKSDGTMAEALIELGALVCRKKPDCQVCPLNKSCIANLKNLQDVIPKAEVKKAKVKLLTNLAVVECQGKILIYQPKTKLMKDLWQFPSVEKLKDCNIELGCGSPLKPVKASFTNFLETILPVYYSVDETIQIPGYEWISKETFTKLSFSSGHKRVLNQLL